MRILYTGPLRPGSVTRWKLDGLHELGYDIVPLDQGKYLDRGPKLFRKAQNHALIGPGIVEYNRALSAEVERTKPDLVYIDVGSYIWPETVNTLRQSGARLVHYTSEYLGNRMYGYWYRHFWPSLPYYDAHVVTNQLSRRILEERGARTIVMSEFGYDPVQHAPPALTDADRRSFASDLVFIGHWEPTTERMIGALRKAGMDVKVWGHGWWKAWRFADRFRIRRLSPDDYTKAIAAAKVALCFLSKWNRNEACGRTFEIPAIGTFMLAERTSQHTSYFVEGKEAAFFGSADELVEKAKYFLSNEDERTAIARSGRQRCLGSGYAYKDRIKRDIESVVERLDRASAA